MINGPVAHVELEHEIATQYTNGVALRQIVQGNVE